MRSGDRRLFSRGMLAAAMATASGGGGGGRAEAKDAPPPAKAFDLRALVADQAKAGEEWREFFRVKALSLGVYALKKGAVDKQSPHKQDEIYYVVSGRATLTVEDKAHPVEAGSVVYVAAHAKHRFHDITDDLTTLVFFAPAYEE
ncbi:MAG TPA: cupin domain-containing protein [Vicinamibacteria bacterium]|nr:cupin domain-containing protein [Vicinamibacteria bacterium]